MKLPVNLSLKSRIRLINILLSIVVWVAALNLLVFLRFTGNPTSVNPVNTAVPIDISALYLNVTRGGIILGIVLGLLELIFERRMFKIMSYGRIILVKSVFYIFIFVLTAFLTNFISFTIYHGSIDFDQWTKNSALVSWQVPLVYISLVCILINSFKEINLKFGPGNLFKLLLGRFHKPKRDRRIFMFLDLRSSTSIAEKLGHIKISRLLQDCFTDLSVVRNYKAEIYQYVGDEVILSWSISHGLENLNCIKAYFNFQNLLESRSDFYKKKYGLVPFFKAGLNVGDVTIAEVGQIKREIAFHGDTLNTASRIEGMCNEYEKGLLLSQTLKKLIEERTELKFHMVGEVLLRGKSKPLKIYSIDEIDLNV
ncbi:MAG: adenylate/guanylate cyclase domain-containing protein [Eudoraea sp.]|uniref:adenylate/guanylate cyclase domain-containing protein n=1 Tax=Eudoraea sp. TaxID=1979955 RepID=UPI0032655099